MGAGLSSSPAGWARTYEVDDVHTQDELASGRSNKRGQGIAED